MLKLTDQQSLRIAELPEDYRVVGVDRAAPLVRKPNSQIVRIQPNGRLIAATIAAKRRLADRSLADRSLAEPSLRTSLTVEDPLGSSRLPFPDRLPQDAGVPDGVAARLGPHAKSVRPVADTDAMQQPPGDG